MKNKCRKLIFVLFLSSRVDLFVKKAEFPEPFTDFAATWVAIEACKGSGCDWELYVTLPRCLEMTLRYEVGCQGYYHKQSCVFWGKKKK